MLSLVPVTVPLLMEVVAEVIPVTMVFVVMLPGYVGHCCIGLVLLPHADQQEAVNAFAQPEIRRVEGCRHPQHDRSHHFHKPAGESYVVHHTSLHSAWLGPL